MIGGTMRGVTAGSSTRRLRHRRPEQLPPARERAKATRPNLQRTDRRPRRPATSKVGRPGANIGTNPRKASARKSSPDPKAAEAIPGQRIDAPRHFQGAGRRGSESRRRTRGRGRGRRTSGKGDEEAAKALEKTPGRTQPTGRGRRAAPGGSAEYANALRTSAKRSASGSPRSARPRSRHRSRSSRRTPEPEGRDQPPAGGGGASHRLASEQREVEQQPRYMGQTPLSRRRPRGPGAEATPREKRHRSAETRAAETRNQVLRLSSDPSRSSPPSSRRSTSQAAGAIAQAQANQLGRRSNADLLAGTVEAQQAMPGGRQRATATGKPTWSASRPPSN